MMKNTVPGRSYTKSRIAAATLAALGTGALALGAAPAPTFAATAHAQPQEAMLTAEQVARDVGIARSAYARIHPGYTRYTSAADMDAAWDSIIDRARADGGMSLGDFYLALNRTLALIRCDHTKAELPKALAAQRAERPPYLPLRWTWLDGRALVANAAPGTGLQRGDEILSVDGRPIAAMVAEITPYLPIDGYTEWSRRGAISQSREYQGGGLDHFGSLLWDYEPQARLEVRGTGGRVREISVQRTDYDGWLALAAPEEGAANFPDAIRFEELDARTAYLAVDSFVNYRNPADPEAILDPVFEALAQGGQDTLILDLRKNGGGSNDATYGLMSYLLAESYTPMKDVRVATIELDDLRPYLTSWEPQALEPDPRAFTANDDGTLSLLPGLVEGTREIEPQELAFGGRLIVLIGDANSSASTNLIAGLKANDRATFIGSPTGGSAQGVTAGILFMVKLPESGIAARLPVLFQYNNVPAFETGLGVAPDIAAPMTAQAFLSGGDPALEAALQLAAIPFTAGTAPAEAAPQGEIAPLSLAQFEPAMGAGWTGELTYTDYGSGKLVSIPTRMELSARGKRTVRYAIAYPGESSANSSDSWKIGKDGQSFAGMPLTSRSAPGVQPLQFVTQAMGEDAGRPALIRMTYRLGASEIVIEKQVRFQPEEPWLLRSRYSYSR
ncbi:S41 family peptidase [Paraurantiacibacter namhicola]|nr:S41 family peptidase [Paraurantiacibacter namhicola]